MFTFADVHTDEGIVNAGDHPALTDDEEARTVGVLFVVDVFGSGDVFFGSVEEAVIFLGIPDKIS